MRKTLLLLAAVAMAGCAFSVGELETSIFWPREDKAIEERTGLALTALRATCSLAECAAMLEEAGVEERAARASCALAWITENKCGGEE